MSAMKEELLTTVETIDWVFGEGYANLGGVDQVHPVDVYIPGCPPRPEAIIYGILVAMGRLESRLSG